jgi:pyridoxamine 5'-phosphate oxidase family protein
VAPMAWRHNSKLGTTEVSGRNFATTRKFREVEAHPRPVLHGR